MRATTDGAQGLLRAVLRNLSWQDSGNNIWELKPIFYFPSPPVCFSPENRMLVGTGLPQRDQTFHLLYGPRILIDLTATSVSAKNCQWAFVEFFSLLPCLLQRTLPEKVWVLEEMTELMKKEPH